MARRNTTAVVDAFLQHRKKAGRSISTNGETIYSYATPIAIREGGRVLLDVTKYSVTTTCQQSDIRYLLSQAGVTVEETTDNLRYREH